MIRYFGFFVFMALNIYLISKKPIDENILKIILLIHTAFIGSLLMGWL